MASIPWVVMSDSGTHVGYFNLGDTSPAFNCFIDEERDGGAQGLEEQDAVTCGAQEEPLQEGPVAGGVGAEVASDQGLHGAVGAVEGPALGAHAGPPVPGHVGHGEAILQPREQRQERHGDEEHTAIAIWRGKPPRVTPASSAPSGDRFSQDKKSQIHRVRCFMHKAVGAHASLSAPDLAEHAWV